MIDSYGNLIEGLDNCMELPLDFTDSVGPPGDSAYEIAVQNGFVGTQEEWLISLHGKDGITPNIQIGNVETLEPDQDATVSRQPDSTDENPILIFGVPKGKNGTTFTPFVSDDGIISWTNDSGIQNPVSINIKGPAGKSFSIEKIYTSIDQMNADHDNTEVPVNGFVLIETGDVNNLDNSKMFIKTETDFQFVTDLSGSQGIQGPTGKTPNISFVVQGLPAGNEPTISRAPGSTDENVIFNLGIPSGENGISPTIETRQVADGVEIVITDAVSSHTISIKNGENGKDGITPNIQIGNVETVPNGELASVVRTPESTNENPVFDFKLPEGKQGKQGVTFTPSITESESGHTLSWVNNGNKPNPPEILIKDGLKGDDGFSPIVSTSTTTNGAKIDITDVNGVKTFTINNGEDGRPGKNGITPNIQVGETITLEPDEPANVSREPTSTNENPIFNFEIPKGKSGVYVGTTEPTDNSNIWLNPDGEVSYIPTKLSELTDDAQHRTVTDAEKEKWNAGTGGGGSTDVSLGMTTAKSGQIAKIKSVDASGKPTEWEPVDMPSGGVGGFVWEKVFERTVSESVASILEPCDVYDGLYRAFVLVPPASGDTNIWVKIGTKNQFGGFILGYITQHPVASAWFSTLFAIKDHKFYLASLYAYTAPGNPDWGRNDGQKITEDFFYIYSSTGNKLIPAGTVINIYKIV